MTSSATTGTSIPVAGRPWSDRPHHRKEGHRAGVNQSPSLDERLQGPQALRVATQLERDGWRAEAVLFALGGAKVEVRAVDVQEMPIVAVLCTEADVNAFQHAFPGRRAPGPRLAAAEWARITAHAAAIFAEERARQTSGDPAPTAATALELRHAAGLGQRALAEALGVSKNYLADLERGRRRDPEAQRVVRRAVALLRTLPKGSGVPPPAAQAEGAPR